MYCVSKIIRHVCCVHLFYFFEVTELITTQIFPEIVTASYRLHLNNGISSTSLGDIVVKY